MNEGDIVRKTSEEILQEPSRSDWARVDAMTDDEIAGAIANDPDLAPEWTEEDFRNSDLVFPAPVRHRALALDEELARWFSGLGPNWREKALDVLRAYAKTHGAR